MTQTVDDVLTNVSVRSQAFVDGAYVDAASGETFDCINPATGRAIASVAACDTEDIDRGRDKSIHALDKYTDLKSIWIAID